MRSTLIARFYLFSCAMLPPLMAATNITFQVPGAVSTGSAGLNNNGDVAGIYKNNSDTFDHGFLRMSDGTITTFDAPESAQFSSVSINDQDVIAGIWSSASGSNRNPQGFVVRNGVFTSFDPPDAQLTVSAYISNTGTIAGSYEAKGAGALLGYFLSPDGTFTTFTGLDGAPLHTVGAVNANGEVAGTLNSTDTLFVFVRHTDGTFLTHAIAGHGPAVVAGVNMADEVAGENVLEYTPILGGGNTYSLTVPFFWNNTFTQFAVTLGVDHSFASGINDLGDVVGFERLGLVAFLRTADSTLTTFKVGKFQTLATGINDAGVICGTAQDNSTSAYGFVRLP